MPAMQQPCLARSLLHVQSALGARLLLPPHSTTHAPRMRELENIEMETPERLTKTSPSGHRRFYSEFTQ